MAAAAADVLLAASKHAGRASAGDGATPSLSDDTAAASSDCSQSVQVRLRQLMYLPVSGSRQHHTIVGLESCLRIF